MKFLKLPKLFQKIFAELVTSASFFTKPSSSNWIKTVQTTNPNHATLLENP